MMTFKGFTTAAAAVAMMGAPVAASAAPVNKAAPLSVVGARAATPVAKTDKAVGSTVINIAILAALVVGVLVFVAGDDDDTPDSP